MLELSLIKETVTQVADAITAVLGIDTEIVDSHLKIISGTGRFHKRVGTYEESGNLDSNEYYARMIRSGKEGVCLDAGSDRNYNRQEGELSEITCPIMVDGDVVGLIGQIAFTAKQHAVLCERTQALLVYLRKMAEQFQIGYFKEFGDLIVDSFRIRVE